MSEKPGSLRRAGAQAWQVGTLRAGQTGRGLRAKNLGIPGDFRTPHSGSMFTGSKGDVNVGTEILRFPAARSHLSTGQPHSLASRSGDGRGWAVSVTPTEPFLVTRFIAMAVRVSATLLNAVLQRSRSQEGSGRAGRWEDGLEGIKFCHMSVLHPSLIPHGRQLHVCPGFACAHVRVGTRVTDGSPGVGLTVDSVGGETVRSEGVRGGSGGRDSVRTSLLLVREAHPE